MQNKITEPPIIAALRAFDDLPNSARVRSPVVRALLGGVSDDTLDRRVKAGVIPKPEKAPGSRINTWTVGPLRTALAAMKSEAA